MKAASIILLILGLIGFSISSFIIYAHTRILSFLVYPNSYIYPIVYIQVSQNIVIVSSMLFATGIIVFFMSVIRDENAKQNEKLLEAIKGLVKE